MKQVAQIKINVVSSFPISEAELQKEILEAETFLNSKSKLRFHIDKIHLIDNNIGETKECSSCRGLGYFESGPEKGVGHSVPCNKCNGTGKIKV